MTAAYDLGDDIFLTHSVVSRRNVSIAQKVTGDAEDFTAYSYVGISPDCMLQDKDGHTVILSATDIPLLSCSVLSMMGLMECEVCLS